MNRPSRRPPPSHRRPVLRAVATGLAALLAAVAGILPVVQASADAAEPVAVRSAVLAPVATTRRVARRRPRRPMRRAAGLLQVPPTVRRLVRGDGPRLPLVSSSVILRL